MLILTLREAGLKQRPVAASGKKERPAELLFFGFITAPRARFARA
jgi:hypothetical protein